LNYLKQRRREEIAKGNHRYEVKDIFNIDLTPMQEKIIDSILIDEEKYKRTVISAMTRYGKSMSVAIGVVMYILKQPKNSSKKIAIVSATQDQSRIIMEYIGRFFTILPDGLYNVVDLDVKGIEKLKKQVSQKRITFKNGCELRILSAEGTGQRIMGFGADLLVMDESCLISDDVWRLRISRMLGDNPDAKLIEIGNPFSRDNHMFEHWIDPNYYHLHIGWKTALKEGRATESFIEEQRSQLTPLEFTILYDADFPEESEDQLISYAWIKNAIDKDFGDFAIEHRYIGLDVAEAGNDLSVATCIAETHRKEFLVTRISSWHKGDTMATVGEVKYIHSENSGFIKVDATGVGKGVYDRLKEDNYQCAGIKVGSRPLREPWRFINLKAQLFWYLRTLFEEGRISIPNHPTLIKELTSLKYTKSSGEKIKILQPGETDRKGMKIPDKSPDFADSLMLSVAEVGSSRFTIKGGAKRYG